MREEKMERRRTSPILKLIFLENIPFLVKNRFLVKQLFFKKKKF